MIFQTPCNYCGFENEHVNKLGPKSITKILSRARCDQHILHSSAIYATDSTKLHCAYYSSIISNLSNFLTFLCIWSMKKNEENMITHLHAHRHLFCTIRPRMSRQQVSLQNHQHKDFTSCKTSSNDQKLINQKDLTPSSS